MGGKGIKIENEEVAQARKLLRETTAKTNETRKDLQKAQLEKHRLDLILENLASIRKSGKVGQQRSEVCHPLDVFLKDLQIKIGNLATEDNPTTVFSDELLARQKYRNFLRKNWKARLGDDNFQLRQKLDAMNLEVEKALERKRELDRWFQLLQKSTEEFREKNAFLESRKLKVAKDIEMLDIESSENILQYDKAIKESKQTLFSMQKEAARLTRGSRRLTY